MCRTLLYSSEAQATLQPLPDLASSCAHAPSSKPAKSIDAAPAPARAMYRIDMDDAVGEVYLVSYQPLIAGKPGSYPPSVTQLHMAHMSPAGPMPLCDKAVPWPLFSSCSTSEKLAQTAHRQTNGCSDKQSGSSRHAHTPDRILAHPGAEGIQNKGRPAYTCGRLGLTLYYISRDVLKLSEAACGCHHGEISCSVSLQHQNLDLLGLSGAVSIPVLNQLDVIAGLQLHMAVYCLAEKRCIDRHEFLDSHRLVTLQDNPYIPMPAGLTGSKSRSWKHQVSAYILPRLCLFSIRLVSISDRTRSLETPRACTMALEV